MKKEFEKRRREDGGKGQEQVLPLQGRITT
jgi:hypothetical protein